MTLSMPPTMIETFGVPEAPSPLLLPVELLRPQAATEVATARASAATASRLVVCFMFFSWFVGRFARHAGEWVEGGVSSDAGSLVAGRRAPRGQPLLELGDQPLRQEGQHRDHDHPGVDAGGVEVALGLVDQQTHALVGTDHLTH